ncbi:MAG: hypothetical protein OXG98_18180 [Gemmatimonadetes bacterium]|nr:hypothetical protein [Gemmatimonadota bacterium]
MNDVVTDTAMAFATAASLGLAPRSPCLPSVPDYRAHLAVLPFKTTLFLGDNNRLNRPLARRLNLDAECGMPKSVHTARSSGNIKDYYHVQEVAAGSVFHGSFLHVDPLRLARETYGGQLDRLVVRLGLGRNGAGLLERIDYHPAVHLNLHTARLFDPGNDLPAGPYRLHNIQPSRALDAETALNITAGWN